MKVSRSKGRRGGYPATAGARFSRGESAAPPFRAILERIDEERGGNDVAFDLSSVDEAAKALKASPTLDNWRAYRDAVRAVLGEITKSAYRVEEIRSFDKRGRRTLAMLVMTVDQRLDELGRLILSGAQDSLAIAAKIDDIRGILHDHLR